GSGDTADRVNYDRLAQDSQMIAQIVEDIARSPMRPQFLETPIYPRDESASLLHELDLVEKERKDLPQAYRMIFADFKARLKSDNPPQLRTLGAPRGARLRPPPPLRFHGQLFPRALLRARKPPRHCRGGLRRGLEMGNRSIRQAGSRR